MTDTRATDAAKEEISNCRRKVTARRERQSSLRVNEPRIATSLRLTQHKERVNKKVLCFEIIIF